MWVAMHHGLSAREERAFAEIIRELEPTKPQSYSRFRLRHLCVLAVGWMASWVALISAVQPTVLAFGCFLALAAFTSGIGYGVLEASTRTIDWDSSMETKDKITTLWRNLRA